MKFITVVLLCFANVYGEQSNLMQFIDDVTQYGLRNNYDVVLVDLNVPFLDVLTQELMLPTQVYQSSCNFVGRPHLFYFMNSSKHISSCLNPLAFPIIFYRNSSSSVDAVSQTSTVLRQLRIAKAIHVIYDAWNFKILYYTYLQADEPQTLSELINPSASTSLHGYQYHISYKRLYPYFYIDRLADGKYYLIGLDRQLTETIATYQNATIIYKHDDNGGDRCPEIQSEIDIHTRRSACNMISVDRLHLPQWDATCVVVPKRHERLILLQFTKPFQAEAWILTTVFVIVRFFFNFDRWRLLLLSVVLIEFILTASYEVKVIQYMTTLRYAPNPRTMVELINRGERFVVGEPELDFLEAYGKGINLEVVSKNKEIYMGKRAMLSFCQTAEAFVNSYKNYNPQTNDRLVIVLRERLKPHPSSYGFARNHPLRERFERMLEWMFESGIWRKIYDQYVREEEQFRPLVASEEYLIEFRDLAPLWVVCGVGWLGSSVVFVVEVAWKCIHKGLGAVNAVKKERNRCW